MTYLQLRHHVSFATIEDRAVFLDLRRDRYFALDGAAAESFNALRFSPGGLVSAEHIEALLATDLFAWSHEPCDCLPAQIPVPDEELSEDLAMPRPRDVIRALYLVVRCRRAVRKHPLELVIAERHVRSAGPGETLASAAALPLAQRFLRARAFVPIGRVCLQDSLALYDWLTAHRTRPSLVVGVQLHPFAAHCWVQLGRTVLNDAVDKVTKYTPVLVVG